jgi:hypothetical protein
MLEHKMQEALEQDKLKKQVAAPQVPRLLAGDFYVVCYNGDVYGPYNNRGEAKDFNDHKNMGMDYIIDGADLVAPAYHQKWTSGKLNLHGTV